MPHVEALLLSTGAKTPRIGKNAGFSGDCASFGIQYVHPANIA
jgi:hypothetical protein